MRNIQTFVFVLLCGCGGAGSFGGKGGSMSVRSAMVAGSTEYLTVSLNPDSLEASCELLAKMMFKSPSVLMSVRKPKVGVLQVLPRREFLVNPALSEAAWVEYSPQPDAHLGAKSGSVTFESLSMGADARATGRFELEFETGPVTGSFEAGACP
jgi:hypothetical protein